MYVSWFQTFFFFKKKMESPQETSGLCDKNLYPIDPKSFKN